MNRKDRLKVINTPEKRKKQGTITENIYQFNQANTSINNDVYYESDSLLGMQDTQKLHQSKNKFIIFLKYLFQKTKLVCIAIPYILVLYLIIFKDTSDISEGNFDELKKEILALKQQNYKLQKHEKLINLCKIEEGTIIEVNTEDIYKYGMLGFRKFNDSNIVFTSGISQGKCMALKGSQSQFFIKFCKPATINNFCIFHPTTQNIKSSIKNFELYGYLNSEEKSIGSFTYDITGPKYQVFEFKNIKIDTLLVKLRSNNGYSKYTTIYRLYIFGIY